MKTRSVIARRSALVKAVVISTAVMNLTISCTEHLWNTIMMSTTHSENSLRNGMTTSTTGGTVLKPPMIMTIIEWV